jgi:transposase-like protein
MVRYEAIRQWVNKFGYLFARKLKKNTAAMATPYISMKCSLKLMESNTIYGERWIKTVMW